MWVEKSIETTLLLRFDKYEKLLDNFDNNKIIFSCPANWLNFALKNRENPNKVNYNKNVGDRFECAFAKINTCDFNSENYVDHFGKPLGNNLLTVNYLDGKTYLFYQPILLIPTLCLYSINGNDIFDGQSNIDVKYFDAKEYAHYFFDNNLDNENGVLIIHNPNAFWEDLNNHIKKALKRYSSRLTHKNFYFINNKSSGNNFLAQNVQYCSFYHNETFNIRNEIGNEIFCKSDDFKEQSEARIIIPNINFKERISDIENYKYFNNELPINLPKLHSYAKLFRISDLPIIPLFHNISHNINFWRMIK